MLSSIKALNKAVFPEFLSERVYMKEFFQEQGLPKELERWQPTVDAMLQGIKTKLPIYLMVDQAEIKPNMLHRRGGLHVDGFWCAVGHGHDRHGRISMHGESGPEHAPNRPSKNGHDHRPSHVSRGEKETLLLASNVVGCKAYVGEYEFPQWNNGDCSSVDKTKLQEILMQPGIVYGGNTLSMLHESIPIDIACKRTVVRLNVPGVCLWENMH